MAADRGAFPRYLMNAVYESKEITVPNGETAYDVKVTDGMFATVPEAHQSLIRSNKAVKIRLNLNTNDEIKIIADVPFPIDTLIVKNIFVRNASGSPAIIDIVLS